jgi:RHS repeat-associated protein
MTNTTGATSTYSYFDWSTDALAELTGLQVTASPTATTVTALVSSPITGNWIAQQSGPTVTSLAQDVYGSTIAATGTTLQRSSVYNAWGTPTGTNTLEARLGYRGELAIDTGLNLRARTYTTATGRFTSLDPLPGDNGSSVVANPYHYALNSPANYADPTGMKETATGGSTASAAAPKIAHWSLPGVSEFRGLGKITIAAFINDRITKLFPGGPDIYAGDDRAFTPAGSLPAWNRNRFVVELDFAAGRATFQVNPTCRATDEGFFFGGGCHDPWDISVNSKPSLGVGDFTLNQDISWKRNYFSLQHRSGGFEVGWSVTHADETSVGYVADALRPRADGKIGFFPVSGGWGGYFQGDCFPSVEVFHSVAGKTENWVSWQHKGPVAMMDQVSQVRHLLGKLPGASGSYC